MAAELYIVGREPLPSPPAAWELALNSGSRGLFIYDADSPEMRTFLRETLPWLDFKPRSVVKIRTRSDTGVAVAEALSEILAGVVFDDASFERTYDSCIAVRRVRSLADVEDILRDVFNNPEPYMARWEVVTSEQLIDITSGEFPIF